MVLREQKILIFGAPGTENIDFWCPGDRKRELHAREARTSRWGRGLLGEERELHAEEENFTPGRRTSRRRAKIQPKWLKNQPKNQIQSVSKSLQKSIKNGPKIVKNKLFWKWSKNEVQQWTKKGFFLYPKWSKMKVST